MRKLACLIVFALVPASLCAQNTGIGLSPLGSFTPFGFDTVNNQNLNVVFSIPIVSSTGRGMPLGLSLVNNSLVYQIVGGAWTPAVDQAGNPNWGWTKDFPPGGGVGNTSTTSICLFQGHREYGLTIYNNYYYQDALGTVHSFPGAYQTYNNCNNTWSGTYSGSASDDTGYSINLSPNHYNPTVTGPGGQQVANGTYTAVDVNGNYITKTVVSSTETDWTDSVGNKALKILYSPSSTNPTQIQYQFLDGTATGGVPNYQTITLKLTSTNIKTNFGCSNVIEYSNTVNLPTELDIPSPVSGTLTYLFSYEPTPNNSGYSTGRVKKVTLPTAGSYEYDYPGANDSIKCSDGTTMALNRVVSDGTNSATWNFVRSGSTTTLTTPKLADTPNANDTVFTFNSGGAETHRSVYKESPGVNVLRTVNTTRASNGTPATRYTILEDGLTFSRVDTAIDSNGLLDSITEYDWGTGTPPTIRTTSLTYQTSANYTNRNILNLITSKVVKDGSGTVQYRQDTTYDGTTITTCPTGVPQHDDTNYPCSMNYRGNPTQVTTYLTPSTPANGISKNFTYDVFGNLLTAQLNCCQNKTWNYSATTQYSQPDSVVSGTSPSLTNSFTYNQYTGLVLTSTDPNSLKTTATYDFLRRPLTVSQANGSTSGESISYSYDDTHFTGTTTAAIDSTKSIKQVSSAVDGLGRPTTSTTEDINSNVISNISAKYDLVGRAYSTSNPYTGSPSNWTTTQLDVLGRPVTATLQDNSATTFSYSIQTVNSYTTETTKVTDPAGKLRQFQNDAAGRLVTVTEPDVNNNLNQNTLYAYNVLDELTTVTEGSQTRAFAYDALGRLLSATTPESGRTCFGSVSGATCNSDGYDNFNNLQKRTDARGVLTTYGYDGLNRLTNVSYNVGTTGVPATSTVGFTYGNDSSCNSAHGSGCIGNLITVTDGVGSENYSYNPLEQLSQLQKVIGSSTYTTSYAYNLAGELTQITYPSTRVVQQSVDAIGRLCEIAPSTTGCATASSPFATGFGYSSASQLTGFKYGNGIFASFGFSSDRLQLNCLDYSTTNRGTNCAHDATTKLGLSYSYGTSGSNNGQIAGITDSVDNGRSATYVYDQLSRLSSAVTAGSSAYPAWGLQWAYDRYGNRSSQQIKSGSGCTGLTCPTNSVTISASTNQISGSPYAYDSNGNMTNDGSNTITYDAENRAVSAVNGSTSGTYVYDGNGLRVQKSAGGTTTVYIFSGSKVIAEYDNGAAVGSPSREYVYAGATLLAKIDSSGTKYYHQDHLSNRLVTDSSGNTVAQQGHFPFGEQWYPIPPASPATKWEFTSYERDSESGNDYAMARFYVNRLGRFSASDPLSGSTVDPQSLDHYSYVRNDPIDFLDPTGEFFQPFCIRVNAGDCGSGGGGGGSWEADLIDFAFTALWNDEGPFFFPNIGLLNFIGPGDLPDPSQSCAGPLAAGCLVNAAVARALELLENPKCAKFIGGGFDAADILNSLASGDPNYGNIQVGPISISDPGHNINATTTLDSTVRVTNYAADGSVVSGILNPVTININNDPLTRFNNPPAAGQNYGVGGTTANAVTVLHELGHAINFMFAGVFPDNPSGIMTDGPSVPGGMLLSRLNTARVYENCIYQ